jgi:uncharacterized membrane protein YqjE
MFPPLLKLVIEQPALLGEHLEAYASLLLRDVALWQQRFQRRLLLNLLLVAGTGMSLMLACIAVMLWVTTDHGSPLLIVIPLLPVTLASSIFALQAPPGGENFAASRAQLHADVQMLKEELQRD